uniref:Clp ATPase C-terminal domain-containing protein n=1 Tax=Plectus sambesii TaxID=2011161 RepID=A0A914URV2_9BILA
MSSILLCDHGLQGRLTDGHGKTVMCRDAVFIMTSNLAANEISSNIQIARLEAAIELIETIDDRKVTTHVTVSKEFKETVIQEILKAHFKRDEFLGRINEMVYFYPFTKSELRQLVVHDLELWQKRSKKKHRIFLSWEANVVDVLIEGYFVHYGARSIKNEVNKRVISMLALDHELGRIGPHCKVTVTSNYGKVDVSAACASIELQIDDGTQQ